MKRFHWIWGAVLAAVLAAGCGGDSETPTSSGSKTPAGTEASKRKPIKLPEIEVVAPTKENLEQASFVAIQDPGIEENVNLFLFGENGKPLGPLTRDGIYKYELDLSPDGKWLAFMLRPKISPSRKDVVVMNLETGEVTNLTENLPPQHEVVAQRERGAGQSVYLNSSPSFTKDSQRVVFVGRSVEGSVNLYSVKTDGSDLEKITDHPDKPRTALYLDAEVSPVSDEVVFTRRAADAWNLFVMDMDSGEERQLTENPEGDYRRPTWSPDGKVVAFVSSDAKKRRHWQIWLIHADGTGLRQLTEESIPGESIELSWHPDGDRVAFVYRLGLEDSAENNEVFTVHVETGALAQVSHTPMFESNPHFLRSRPR